MHPFERLDAWQVSHRQTIRVYMMTRSFPDEERYGLTAQLRRSAASVSANIAEGSVAATNKEFLRYLGIAKKSLNEVAHWYILARDIESISHAEWREMNNLNHRVGSSTFSCSTFSCSTSVRSTSFLKATHTSDTTTP